METKNRTIGTYIGEFGKWEMFDVCSRTDFARPDGDGVTGNSGYRLLKAFNAYKPEEAMEKSSLCSA